MFHGLNSLFFGTHSKSHSRTPSENSTHSFPYDQDERFNDAESHPSRPSSSGASLTSARHTPLPPTLDAFTPSSSANSHLRKLPDKLDVTLITQRLLASGNIWKQRTEKKSHRNNIEDLASFLNERYPSHYLIWRLTAQEYDTTPFHHQVLHFPILRNAQVTLKWLFDLVRSMAAWLDSDPANVAIVHCSNGKVRTGLVMACYLRYARLADSVWEPFQHFIQRRSPLDSSWVTSWHRRYAQYFDDIVSMEGQLPNPKPLLLHGIVLNGVPQFTSEGPCNPILEVFQSGVRVYTTTVDAASHDKGLVLQDEFHVLFRTAITEGGQERHVALEKDIEFRVSHCSSQSHHQSSLIFGFSFHTGFMGCGLTRVRRSELELAARDQQNFERLPKDFSVDMIFAEMQSPPVALTYKPLLNSSFITCLAKLTHFHHVNVDTGFMKSLQEQGYTKVLAKFALQRSNNHIHEAHEYLASESGCRMKERIALELKAIGRERYHQSTRRKKAMTTVPEVSQPLQQVDLPSLRESGLNTDRSSSSELYAEIVSGASNEEPHVSFDSTSTNEKRPASQTLKPMTTKADSSSLNLVLVSHQFKQPNSIESNTIPTPVAPTPPPLLSNQIAVPPPPPSLTPINQTVGTVGPPPAPPPPPTLLHSNSTEVPPPPPLPPSAPPPPPPPPSSSSASFNNKKRVKNRFHWEELKNTESTIWKEVSTESDVSFDIQKFENLFCIDPSSESVKPQPVKGKQKRENVLLDLNRARMMGIVLSRFHKRLEFSYVLNAILNFDNVVLNLDDLLALKTILPNDQEKSDANMFLSRNPNYHEDKAIQLNPPEEFLLTFVSEPNIAFMLDAFIFWLQYESEMERLMQSLKKMTDLCDALRKDEEIKALFAIVLKVGNLMNYEYGHPRYAQQATGAVGFRVQSLVKLKDVKSKDGKTTLMHFLLELIRESNPDLLRIPDKYQLLTELRHLNSKDLKSQVHEFRLVIDKLRNYKAQKSVAFVQSYHQYVQPLVKNATELFSKLEKELFLMDASWSESALYFGEDADNMPPEDLFNTLDIFFQSLKDVAAQIEKAQERKERALERQKSMSASPSKASLDSNSDSPYSIREKLLEDIRSRAKLVTLQDDQTASGNSTQPPNTFRECSECGLPIAECDCKF